MQVAEAGLEDAMGAVQAALDRSLPHLEGGGGLGHRPPQEVAADDHRAVLDVELPERGVEVGVGDGDGLCGGVVEPVLAPA